jgi:hypothetical protein
MDMSDADRILAPAATRKAACRCGQLTATCTGEPIRVSACHCLACKARSGSAFAVQVRFPADQVTTSGVSREYVHIADSGNAASFHFCPVCGATLWYRSHPLPEAIAVPLGNFADPWFVAPSFSVWEQRRLDWVEIVGEGVEHSE